MRCIIIYGMAKRLFISVGIPEETAKRLVFAADAISSDLPGKSEPRLTRVDNLHFTIIFLGSQEEETIPLIKEAITEAEALAGAADAKIFLKEADYSDSRRADMVWAYANSDWMDRFSKLLADSLQKRNISFDQKPFKAHLTLIRMKGSRGLAMPDIRTDICEEVGVESVELVESVLMPSGPVYTDIFSKKVGE